MFLALLLLLFQQTRDRAVTDVLFIITTPTCSRSSSFLALLLLFLHPHSSVDTIMLFIVVAFIVVIFIQYTIGRVYEYTSLVTRRELFYNFIHKYT